MKGEELWSPNFLSGAKSAQTTPNQLLEHCKMGPSMLIKLGCVPIQRDQTIFSINQWYCDTCIIWHNFIFPSSQDCCQETMHNVVQKLNMAIAINDYFFIFILFLFLPYKYQQFSTSFFINHSNPFQHFPHYFHINSIPPFFTKNGSKINLI